MLQSMLSQRVGHSLVIEQQEEGDRGGYPVPVGLSVSER